MATPMIQQDKNARKGTVIIRRAVTDEGLKHPQQTVLPQITKGSPTTQQDLRKTHLRVLSAVAEGSLKTQQDFSHTQLPVLPTITKDSLKTQQDFSSTELPVLPPILKAPKKTQLMFSPHQNIVPPKAHTQKITFQHPAIQQQGNMQKSKTKKVCKPKEKQKVKEKPTVERTALTPETVLRESKSYLTDYELEEVKGYKEVWFLGEKAHKTRYSNLTENKDNKSANFGYDNKEGFYKVVMNDHLAYRYEVLQGIGVGYSGQVLKCMDHKCMEMVAIKVIRNQFSFNLLGKTEVQILKTLQNTDEDISSIVQMKDHFYFRNHICISFELLEKDLYQALKETNKRGLDEKEVRKYAIDMLKCLQTLQKNKIIHGDLKPENILLKKKGSVHHAAVTDFGGSCFMRYGDQPLIYTLYYKSPEVFLGQVYNTASDMWSLGCILAELMRGHPLFCGDDNAEHFSSIMKVMFLRDNSAYSDGVPLKIADIRLHRRILHQQLNSQDADFLDFIKCCFEYDPGKRLTPEEALQHPWIQKKDKTAAVKDAEPTRPINTSQLCPIFKPHPFDLYIYLLKSNLNLFHAIKPHSFQFITPTTTTPPQTFQIKRIQLCAAVRPPCVTLLRIQEGETERDRNGEAKMSGIMLLSVSFSLCLLWATGGVARSGTLILRDALEHGPVSLNDMFREVEELMEDTQHILEEAVDQETNNETGETQMSHIHMEITGQWNSVDHECMVDEDCGDLKYCLYGIENSKCLPCIPTDMPCTTDEECCSDQMCVWGQCTVNATKGTEGTICQGQSDCRLDLCCAFQRELLFPVCNPKPGKGESCLNHPNLLMDMLAWDLEGPRDHCPCADDLQCRPHGRGSVCGE
ncbi:dual specificity tyrosine-phosphorylation-regulated kinase 4-like [Scomber scombrus]|uniref:dual-specificity kinase n=1 Tax=Scomber scombrus TaxID=13677 RepID=A0AAV1PEV1_SCOSC